MGCQILVGCQWGDEGKGKMVDLLSAPADCIARYQGGHNAGHTVWVNGECYAFHLLPSGILHPGKLCVIGNGVVVDPAAFLEEVEACRSKGIQVDGRLRVSANAHAILPYHRLLDRVSEKHRGKAKIGTTSRGIGPAYADKSGRLGVKLIDLTCAEILKEKLRRSLEEKNVLLERLYGERALPFEEVYDYCLQMGEKIDPYLDDTVALLNTLLDQGKEVLVEGAQGTLLDIDFGTYPYVTSSNPVAGGACVGLGISPMRVTAVIGVLKAYTTRIGEGPFPTECRDKMGKMLRERGEEYGATTGRARRCGWLDLVGLRYAVRVNGITRLAIMKLDVLSGLDRIQVCTAYEADGERLDSFPCNLRWLQRARPVYESLPGWQEEIVGVTEWSKLPGNARRYLDYISEQLGVPIGWVSTGHGREDNVVLP